MKRFAISSDSPYDAMFARFCSLHLYHIRKQPSTELLESTSYRQQYEEVCCHLCRGCQYPLHAPVMKQHIPAFFSRPSHEVPFFHWSLPNWCSSLVVSVTPWLRVMPPNATEFHHSSCLECKACLHCFGKTRQRNLLDMLKHKEFFNLFYYEYFRFEASQAQLNVSW